MSAALIEFACRCGQRLEAEPQHAGMDVQCPVCGILVTVPVLSDVQAIDVADGTYRMETPAGRRETDRLARLSMIYGKTKVDEHGYEIDLRGPMHAPTGDDAPAGPTLDDPAPDVDPRSARPRYDPITGELITAVDITPQGPRRVLAPGALPKPRRRREVFETLPGIAPIRVLGMLLEPASALVLAMIALAHVFLFIAMIAGTMLLLPMLAVLLVSALLVAHYGNVVEETGFSMANELPRPMRNVNWVEDFWNPIGAMFMMTATAFAPAMIALRMDLPGPPVVNVAIAAGLTVIGSMYAPAVLLIGTCSGNYANLRPDIVWGTIRGCGAGYLVILGTFYLGVGSYATAIVLTSINALASLFVGASMPWYLGWGVCLPLLLVGIYFVHWHLWCLGRAYRVYFANFPWLYQGKVHAENTAAGRGFQVITTPRRPGRGPPAV